MPDTVRVNLLHQLSRSLKRVYVQASSISEENRLLRIIKLKAVGIEIPPFPSLTHEEPQEMVQDWRSLKMEPTFDYNSQKSPEILSPVLISELS